ncbi:XAP5, circadian clock regulator-domain-containing protein [Limtongia smithiae]|uniref:XAP5, circadian clock regulator-domain-containing protein n=1 Tax=Limtongia smithiae TaxID=1125753 RepID=UPI0034CE8615
MALRTTRTRASVSSSTGVPLTRKQREQQELANELLRVAASSSTSARTFVASAAIAEEHMKQEAVGLMDADKLRRVREEAANAKRRGELVASVEEEEEEEEEGSVVVAAKLKATKKRSTKVQKSKLSFADDAQEEDIPPTSAKRRKVDATVDTSFIKTKQSATWEAEQRETLRREYLQQQEQIRQEKVDLQFCYYDGTCTSSSVQIKKGDQVWVMLDRTRKNRKELHRGTVDDMMLVRDNIIIPHHYEFYYFVQHETRTKLGLLFDFEHMDGEDTRRTKVVYRPWYEKHKHIFPASTWQDFDPEVDYTTQVLRDRSGFVYYQQ